MNVMPCPVLSFEINKKFRRCSLSHNDNSCNPFWPYFWNQWEFIMNSAWIQPPFFYGYQFFSFCMYLENDNWFSRDRFPPFYFLRNLKNYVVLKSFIISEYLFLVFITNLSNCPLNFGYLFHIFRLSIIII